MNNIGLFLLGIWLILVGATWLTWISVDSKFLGLLGFIVGIIILVLGVYPYVDRKR
jgi:hypothetical protein